MTAPRETWEVVTHWQDDHNRHWADTQTVNTHAEALGIFKDAKLANRDVVGITIDVVHRDERRFPNMLISWTTTPAEPAPTTPLGTIIARLAAKKRLTNVDG